MPGHLKSKYEFAILKGAYFLSISVKVFQINSMRKNRRFEYKCTRFTSSQRECMCLIFVYLTGNNPYFGLFC